jgi:hypothetical protein
MGDHVARNPEEIEVAKRDAIRRMEEHTGDTQVMYAGEQLSMTERALEEIARREDRPT